MKTREQMQKELQNEIETAFFEKYGPEPAPQLCERLRAEWGAMTKAEQEQDLLLLLKISRQLRNIPHWMNSCAGAAPTTGNTRPACGQTTRL